MKKKILIIDYGTGNLSSISNAFKKFNCEINIDNTIKSINNADLVVLPGVGTFPKAVNLLKKRLIFNYLKKVSKKGKHLFGICLGMQLFSNSSSEIKKTQGLKLIKGDTKKIFSSHHIGWNSVEFHKKSIFNDLNKRDFYFQHQFYIEKSNSNEKAFFQNNNKKYLALIKNKNILGVQFHPEKSQKTGLDFLKIYLNTIYD